MDEVDKIVLSSLTDIGYTPKEDATSLKLYSFQELLEMVMYCLRAIRSEASFPTSLPPAMSNKYQICAKFAETCKELGYKGDIGYHTFMYNNSADVRNVLIFLVEHLPKQNLFEKSSESLDRGVSIKEKMSEELRSMFTSKTRSGFAGSTCRSPFLPVDLETGTLLPNQKIDCKPIEWRDFVVEELPFINEQAPFNKSLLPSVIALNTAGLLNATKSKSKSWNSSAFVNEDLLKILSLQSSPYSGYSDGLRLAPSSDTTTPDSTGCANSMERLHIDSNAGRELAQNEVAALTATSEAEETIARLRDEISETKTQITSLKTKLSEISESAGIAKEKLREKMSHVTSLEQSIALLPDSENNVPKLEAANEKCRAKIQKLESQWQDHQEQLLAKRAELQAVHGDKLNERDELLEIISDTRKELFEVNEEIQRRSALEQRLKEAELGSGVQRSQFIDRILDMIRNIKKQETQIRNILDDMKSVQKEINTLSGKVERSYAVTEKITSNTDEISRDSHRLIVTLHKNISDILTMIDETGKYARDIKDLEDQILDNNNNVEEALKQVMVDLQRMKEEQIKLVKEIQQINGSDDHD